MFLQVVRACIGGEVVQIQNGVSLPFLCAWSSRVSRKCTFKRTETEMKTVKRILWVLLAIVIAAVVGYFIYTGFQV